MSALQFFGGLWLGAAIATPVLWLKAFCYVIAAILALAAWRARPR